jgi:hypothetical protein
LERKKKGRKFIFKEEELEELFLKQDNIEYFDTHIKIDWDKALRQPINREGSVLKVNGSGHLVVSAAEKERRKKKGRKFIFKEEELEELFLKQDNE